MSATPNTSASGSGLMARTVPAARTPTMWLNFPLAPIETNSRGAMVRPVMPIWRARGSHPLSVTLRVAPSSASSSSSSGSRRVVVGGVDAAPDADDGAGLGERVEVVVAGAGEHLHPAAWRRAHPSDHGSSTGCAAAGPGSTPTRTVAICTGELASMAATSWPPKAGFHATSERAPSTSSPTASPVRPAPSRRGRRVPRPRVPTRCSARAPPTAMRHRRSRSSARPASSSTVASVDQHDASAPQDREPLRVVGREDDADDVPVDLDREAGGRAQELTRVVRAVRLHDDRHRRARRRRVPGAPRRRSRPGSIRGRAHRGRRAARPRRDLVVDGAGRGRSVRAAPRGRAPPTDGGRAPAWPHGPRATSGTEVGGGHRAQQRGGRPRRDRADRPCTGR